MADWVTISSLATAGGTLVLAVATFSSVKAGSRSARIAERSLLAGLRPLLIPSREDDPVEYVRFGDGQVLSVPGHGGAVLQSDESIYMAIALRNGGSGLAVLHAWHAEPRTDVQGVLDDAPDTEGFQRQQLDLYIPAGDTGFWQGRIRDPRSPNFERVRDALLFRYHILIERRNLPFGVSTSGHGRPILYARIISDPHHMRLLSQVFRSQTPKSQRRIQLACGSLLSLVRSNVFGCFLPSRWEVYFISVYRVEDYKAIQI